MRPRRSRRYLRTDNPRHVRRVLAREQGTETWPSSAPLRRSNAMLKHVLGNKRVRCEGWVQSVLRRIRERVVQISHVMAGVTS